MSQVLERGILEVGYFLARMGLNDPPTQLNAESWKEAYMKFYATFGGTKSEDEFRNSLKNLRDHFDSHLVNSRTGWREPSSGKPQQLSVSNQEIYDELKNLNDDQLWARVKPYAVLSYDGRLAANKSKEVATRGAKHFSSEFSGKKKIPAKEEIEIIVKHGLVIEALKNYVQLKFPESHVFNTQKIDLALQHTEALAAIYEVKTSAGTQSIYTAVGQLFMHSAGAGNVVKNIVLPDISDNQTLIDCLTDLDIKILWYSIKGESCRFREQ